jgi:hypothetical protein
MASISQFRITSMFYKYGWIQLIFLSHVPLISVQRENDYIRDAQRSSEKHRPGPCSSITLKWSSDTRVPLKYFSFLLHIDFNLKETCMTGDIVDYTKRSRNSLFHPAFSSRITFIARNCRVWRKSTTVQYLFVLFPGWWIHKLVVILVYR